MVKFLYDKGVTVYCTDLQVAGHFRCQFLHIFVNLWVQVDVSAVPQLPTLIFQRLHHFPNSSSIRYNKVTYRYTYIKSGTVKL